MKEALKQLTGKRSLEEIFKEDVKRCVPELKERDDFEVKFMMNCLPCPKCGTENVSCGFFYRFFGSDEWIHDGRKYECEDCQTKEAWKLYEEESKRESRQYLLSRITKEYFHIPDTLKTAGFKNYEVLDNVTGKAKKEALQYVKDFLNSKYYSLLIQGNPGTGKTHLCTAIARTLRERGYIVGFITTGELLRMIKNTYKQGAIKSEEDIFNDLKKMDLLILDDLGSEANGGSEDWRKAQLFEIVNSRQGKPTVYTSNLDDIQLPKAVGSRVHSRLYENTKFIDLFTEDYRKKLRVG